MADFLKVVGTIVFVLALAAMALTYTVGGVIGSLVCLPAAIGGAAVFGLGEIMSSLQAIRRASERQTAALEELTRQNTIKPR